MLLSIVFGATFEPFEVDVTQQRIIRGSGSIDHLEPLRHPAPPEYSYLVQFVSTPTTSGEGHYVVLLRDSAGRYLLRTATNERWTLPSRIPATEAELEIPESLAAILYQIWANAILEVRYDRTGYGGMDGTLYTFSTFVRGLGFLHGCVWSPDEDTPPGWLVAGGERLARFTRFPARDTAAPGLPVEFKRLESDMAALRERLFDHWAEKRQSP